MARRAFYSFHYQPDNFRAAQVRNMGVIEANSPASDNDWEAVKKGGDKAIQKWIDDQLFGKSVAIVLIGSGTAGRKWIEYEIKAAWDAKKGILGIFVHNLKDSHGNQAYQGSNPFDGFTVGGTKMSSIVKAYAPPYSDSKLAYGYIKDNLAAWIENAIAIRAKY
ncbi:TIR domain-containing protein [Urbifossiella limnaea]